ncbi:hypothetical protein A9G83_000667 [Salmonella enterica subsp. enterica serovar Sundsvall]|nr:hypothetical protein [Salmonella enterica subsp. enterica serovar Sundsvall]
MAYGARVFDGAGRDITGMFSPVFFIASYSSASGNVNFGAIPPGKSLKYYVTATANYQGNVNTPNIQVSGSAASWGGLNPDMSLLVFYWG